MPLTVSYTTTNGLFQELFKLLGKAAHSNLVRQIEYLRVENQILRSRLTKKVYTTPSERRRLLRFGQVLGKDIQHCVSIVNYRTFLRWVHESKNHTSIPRKKRGRPRTQKEVEALICRFAKENPSWGYSRILAELKKLKIIRLTRNTVKNILKAHGFDPAPKRGEDSWDAFLKRHMETLWACDFFSKTVWTMFGPKTFNVLFFLHVQTRKVYIAGITTNPTQEWTIQHTQKAELPFGGTKDKPAMLIRDRDKKYSPALDAFLQSQNVKVKLTSFRSPNLNPYAEGWVGTIKRECLNHFIVFGEQHLRHLITEYITYYNTERAHPALADTTPWPMTSTAPSRLTCKNRLGGLLRRYERANTRTMGLLHR